MRSPGAKRQLVANVITVAVVNQQVPPATGLLGACVPGSKRLTMVPVDHGRGR